MTSATPRSTRIIVPIVAAEPPIADQVRAALAGGADLVELRVDLIADPAAVEHYLRSADAAATRGRAIVTIRGVAEGGAWDGEDADRVALYERLGLLLPGFLDIEFALWTRSANLRQKLRLVCDAGDGQDAAAGRARNQLILSCHAATTRAVGARGDGARAPIGDVWRELSRLADEMHLAAPGAIVKLVAPAIDARDAITAMNLLHTTAAARPTIALAMNDAGLASRVLAAKLGAWATFAALDTASASAPGQPTIAVLRDDFRFRSLNPATAVFGVVGWPVAQSLSPRLHNALMARDAIDGVYLPLPIEPTQQVLFDFLDALSAAPWLSVRGLSVTVPHKEHALRWLIERGHETTDAARRYAAVNTLTHAQDGSWQGDNTDAPAAIECLAGAFAGSPATLRGKRVAVLGAGGAGRSICRALLDAGARVTLFNRNRARADEVAGACGCASDDWECRAAADFDAIVNATTVGMTPHDADSPMPADALQPGMVVFDTVYRPRETALLRAAKARGCIAVDGVEMFIRQAALQYARWHDRPADLDACRDVLRDPR